MASRLSVLNRREGRGREQGFTLIELIVALAIAALLVGLMPSALSRFSETVEYRNTVRQLLSGLVSARQEAMRTGLSTVVAFDLEHRTFRLGERSEQGIPARLDLRLITAGSEIVSDSHGNIRFFADGSSTGGSVEIRRPSGDGMRLRVDWLLGRVTQEALLGEAP